MNLKYEVEFKSDIDTGQKIINELLHKFEGYLNSDDIFDLRLILNELISNSIIHGNGLDSGKHVHLKLTMKDDVLDLIVTDEGKGIKIKKQKVPNRKSISGRGLLLVKGLTDTFDIMDSSVRVTRRFQ
ncbi:MAG TPA: ATP-binding protein [Clostridiales bacterium]|nr:ATP-binding protein [Clostridiales bacterium]